MNVCTQWVDYHHPTPKNDLNKVKCKTFLPKTSKISNLLCSLMNIIDNWQSYADSKTIESFTVNDYNTRSLVHRQFAISDSLHLYTWNTI